MQFAKLEDRIFSDRGTRLIALFFFAAYAATLARFFVDYHWPYYPKEHSTGCVDFGWVWLSGSLPSGSVFNDASFAKAQADLFGASRCTVLWPFPYPPMARFFTRPVGLLPFVPAYVAWTVALTALFLAAFYAIVRRWTALIGSPASNPAIVNIYLGQNTFLTAGLFGFALIALERRPVVSGALFALLTYKPQFGVMIPVALVASRNWRALTSATACSVMFALAATLAFGSEGWSNFFGNLLHRDPTLSPNQAFELDLESVYGIVHSAGLGSSAAWAAQGALIAGLAAAVWLVWSKPVPHALRAALLCIASLLASPYVLYYDLCILVVAAAFLIRDGLNRGFLTGDRTGIFACATAFLLGPVLGPTIACVILLWLVFRRIAPQIAH